jgi:hypothetical protein
MFPRVVQRFGTDQTTPITKVLPGQMNIQNLRDYLPATDDLSNTCTPILQDQKTNTKNKKKEVLAYLDEKITETERCCTQAPSPELKQRFEAKEILWRLLKVLCEQDGSLPGR